VICDKPDAPHAIERAGLDENLVTSAQQVTPQPLVLPKPFHTADGDDIETRRRPDRLVVPLHLAPKRLDAPRIIDRENPR
jgi:hypothetical protein